MVLSLEDEDSFTVTLQVSVWDPSALVTVIVEIPTVTPVTVPFDTVATEVSLEDHVTSLLVALEGITSTVSFCVLPFSIVSS